MLGKHHSKSSKKKIGESNKVACKGRVLSKESISKRTETRRKNGWLRNPEATKEKMSRNNARAMKGRVQTVEARLKTSLKVSGSLNPNWQGGTTPINDRERKSLRYRLWREEVFERDNFMCQICGLRGVELNADHIKPFALYPELRFEPTNGRTLCVPCHRQTGTYGYSQIYRITKKQICTS